MRPHRPQRVVVFGTRPLGGRTGKGRERTSTVTRPPPNRYANRARRKTILARVPAAMCQSGGLLRMAEPAPAAGGAWACGVARALDPLPPLANGCGSLFARW